MHLVILPHALILLRTVLSLTVLGTWECDLTLAVLDLATIKEFPLAHVQGLIDVFESAEALLGHLRLLFLDLSRDGRGIFTGRLLSFFHIDKRLNN